jgi:hypothetical protein
MIDFLTLYPPYLVFLTVLLVLFPAIVAIGIRVTLYRYFQDSTEKVKRLIKGNSPGIQPKIVTNLEERFRRASEYLETVNTSALIDELYGEEKFSFFGFSLNCAKWDYFGTILPNLLLAFGLLGTFWGITQNLTNIGSVINQGSANSSDLIEQLKIPLQSMGIAFITSLVALLFSSIITVVNFFFNTNIARVRLLSSLEDYLDNIVQPTIQGRSRLDRAVNRMVEQQNDFLLNFHNNVTRIMESSLTKVAQQINDGNQETARLVTQVCERLTETAGTLSNGGDTFQRSTRLFQEQVTKLDTIIQHENFVKYSATLDSCASKLQNTVDNFVNSKVTENLVTTARNLDSTQERFSTTVQSLQGFSTSIQQAIDTLNTSLQNSLAIEEQIRDLSQDFYHLQQQSYQLDNSNGQRTIDTLNDLRNNLVVSNNKVAERLEQVIISLQNMHNNLLETTHNVNNNSEIIQELGNRLTQTITRESERGNYQSQIVAQRSEQTVGYLRDIQQILQQLTIILNTQNGNGIARNPLTDR